MPLPPWHPEALAARLPFLDRRARLTAETRAFFSARGYREVETPALVPAPGAEVHLRADLRHLGDDQVAGFIAREALALDQRRDFGHI